LKGRPILDLLANSVGYGCVAFGIGWLALNPYSGTIWLKSIPYCLCIGATFVNTTLLDIKGDELVGDRTTGVMLGFRASCWLSLILLTMSLASAILLRNLLILAAALVSLPFFVRTIFRTNPATVSMATKVGIISLSLAVGFFVPLYIMILAIVILLVSWYYRVRFGIIYP
jgi:4-hydroxybenzoate polyprenyltransferase